MTIIRHFVAPPAISKKVVGEVGQVILDDFFAALNTQEFSFSMNRSLHTNLNHNTI